MVQSEQKKIIGCYMQLENRYKEVIQENKAIRGELADLRRNIKGRVLQE